MRTIRVTGGRSDYATMTLTDTRGNDLATATIRLGLTTSATTDPADWFPPDIATYPTAGKAELSLLIDETRAPAGTYWLVADVVDNPTSQPVVAETKIRTV
jgi:hypothetical protein